MTLHEYIAELKGKRIAVIGLGVSNRPLMELLLEAGCNVTGFDKRDRSALGEIAVQYEAQGAQLCLGPDYLEHLDQDIIFRTPGMHPFTPALQAAAEKGSLITSEMEVFFQLCPCKTVCVTGSDGKTTTTTIIARLLQEAGYTVHLGGNIGRPLLPDIPIIAPDDIAVLELSSFQLHSMKCKPDVAVITNVAPNHLDVHPSFEDYVDAKCSIFRNQDKNGLLVLNRDNIHSAAFAKEARGRVLWFSRQEAVDNGLFMQDGVIYRANNQAVQPMMSSETILLPGLHNRENYMAAFAAVDALVSDDICREVAASFTGVAHRLEIVRKLHGVTYYNDSIGTSPTRTIAGLRSFDLKPILIAGGYDKHIPFDALGDEICRRVKALVLTGDSSEKIRQAVTSSALFRPDLLPIIRVEEFQDAVLTARNLAEPGDVVLLSPACAAFDKFANFVQRGETFRRIVEEME